MPKPLSQIDEKISTQSFQSFDDGLDLFYNILPNFIQSDLAGRSSESLIEIVMDLGRPAEARYSGFGVQLSDRLIEMQDIEQVTKQLSAFGEDNRAGIERTLHRISAIRNRKGEIIGITLRVGRTFYGSIEAIKDLIASGKNILFLGPPGVGKTSKLRETARVLANDYQKRVIVVDTSNEIGGDGDIPHPAIGRARRMQVAKPDFQHRVMIEAVENHMPEVIIIDEIGTISETMAARTIAERGVQLIATAHGTTLENLILNPTLSDLVGGIQTVTLSDEEAKYRGTQKTINERRAPPTFDVIIELVSRDEMIIHRNTAKSVDAILLGANPEIERRGKKAPEFSKVPSNVAPDTKHPELDLNDIIESSSSEHPIRIYAYALDPKLLERVIRNMNLHAKIVSNPNFADLILGLKSRSEDLRLQKILSSRPIPAHFIKKNSSSQMRNLLRDLFYQIGDLNSEQVSEAVREAEHAIQRVLNEGVEVSLAPRVPPVRKLQHKIISRYHLLAESVGKEPVRHLIIHSKHETH